MATSSNVRTGPEQASECARRLLGAKPDLVDGHFLAALIALELKQNWTAVSAFGSVTKLEPKHVAAWAHLARLFMMARQPARADAALAKAVEHSDGNRLVLDIIGAVHTMPGDHQRREFVSPATSNKQGSSRDLAVRPPFSGRYKWGHSRARSCRCTPATIPI